MKMGKRGKHQMRNSPNPNWVKITKDEYQRVKKWLLLHGFTIVRVKPTLDANNVIVAKAFPMNKKSWLTTDAATMAKLFEEKKTLFEVAEHFNRSAGAVVSRGRKLGLIHTNKPKNESWRYVITCSGFTYSKEEWQTHDQNKLNRAAASLTGEA